MLGTIAINITTIVRNSRRRSRRKFRICFVLLLQNWSYMSGGSGRRSGAA